MQTVWQLPLAIPRLEPGSIQLWRLSLAALGHGSRDALLSQLNPEEQARASALRVDWVRDEFVAARGLLRTLLAAALTQPAQSIVLTRGPAGKPAIDPSHALDFNVSHSKGLVLVGLSRAGAIGVDAEYREASLDKTGELLNIAHETLSPDTCTSLANEPDTHARLLRFYAAWTHKEALAKADGRGIAQEIAWREVSASRHSEESVVELVSQPGVDLRYRVRTLDIGPLHAGAFASLDVPHSLSCLDAKVLLP